MNGYFKLLRRKFGVVTLLLAMVFMAGWMRSLYDCDYLLAPTLYICSGHGVVQVEFGRPNYGMFEFKTVPTEVVPDPCVTSLDHVSLRNYGFNFRKYSYMDMDGRSSWTAWCFWIPYMSIVMPAVLLSTWLLLWTPRMPKPARPVAENA